MCALCGKWFKVPFNAKGQYTRRVTCGSKCARELLGWKISLAHERRQAEDPEGYVKWVGRDFVAMGRAGGTAKAQAKRQ